MRQPPPQRPDTYTIRGFEILKKTVARTGLVGRVYLPAHWVGKTVKVIRID